MLSRRLLPLSCVLLATGCFEDPASNEETGSSGTGTGTDSETSTDDETDSTSDSSETESETGLPAARPIDGAYRGVHRLKPSGTAG